MVEGTYELDLLGLLGTIWFDGLDDSTILTVICSLRLYTIALAFAMLSESSSSNSRRVGIPFFV